MYQWRVIKSKSEEDYVRRMAKEVNIPYIADINLKKLDLSDPILHISEEDELKIKSLDTKLNEAIELLKEDTKKSYFNFNGLMYCKLYPRYKGHQDEIVVMDLYYDDIRSNVFQTEFYSINKGVTLL